MPSRKVSSRWKSCMFVVSAYKVHREDLLTGLAELTEPSEPPGDLSEEPQAPEITSIEEAREQAGSYLDSVVETMERRAVQMVKADEVNLAELARAKVNRTNRDDFAGVLGRQYVRQRDAFTNLYDEKTAREAGFESNVEQEPTRLTLQVRRAVNGLTSGKLKLGVTFGKIKIDPVDYGEDLEPGVKQLEKVLKDLNNGIRETQGTILAKNEAIKVYDKVFTPGARSLEAAFRLAGMTDLADRVKPSTRRPGRLADVVASESEGQEGQGQAGEEQESEGQKGGAPSVESLGIEEDGTTDA